MSEYVAPLMRKCLLFFVLLALFSITSCAHSQVDTGFNNTKNETKTQVWAGRISLQIQSEPAQAFFAGFELKGQTEIGELTLISPLGSILTVMRWSPGEAVLEQAGSTKRFASKDELLMRTTGEAIPVSALFDWLAGINTKTSGWTADLSQLAGGRISAKKGDPAPQADLRIVLDK